MRSHAQSAGWTRLRLGWGASHADAEPGIIIIIIIIIIPGVSHAEPSMSLASRQPAPTARG